MRFRLKSNAGRHHDGSRVYKAGDTVTSDTDLVKAFPGKFIRLDGKRTAADEEQLDEDLPRAAKVGTKLESAESKEETGEPVEGEEPAPGLKAAPAEDEDAAPAARASRRSRRTARK